MSPSPFILGTVQLGMRYGIANQIGRPDTNTAIAIVRECLERGVDTFDTAQHYGESEAVLGMAIQACGAMRQTRVITKLSPQLTEADAATLKGSVNGSLARLGLSSLDTLMFHREEHLALLDGPTGNALKTLVDEGVAARIGISVYTPGMALQALLHPLIRVVQLPASFFDRRFEAAGVFKLAIDNGKEIHVRSALMQGLLGLSPSALAPGFSDLFPYLERFHQACHSYDIPWAVAALTWVTRRHPSSRVLFGAESVEQVQQNLDVALTNGVSLLNLMADMDDICPPQREDLINPALWQRKTHE
jgi:aryl-alcohol dehydrogenase-like predicted oxidoreductase